jgi:hypothetical protein
MFMSFLFTNCNIKHLPFLGILFCLTFFYGNIHSQSLIETPHQKVGQVEIPFRYINGFIVLDVVFQKIIPLKFIFDTGAENTILFKREYAEVMKIPYQKRIKILGSDMSHEIYANICNGVYLQITNMKAMQYNMIVLEDDYLYLEEYIGSPVDGILGADFFKNMVVKIDYRKEVITLIAPNYFKKESVKKYTAFDIEVISRKPYLTCTTEVNPGLPKETRLLLDTGAGISAIIHHNSDTSLTLKNNIIKGNLGKGLGGNIEGFSGKIHSLRIGKFSFENMIASFQTLDDVLISKDKIVKNGLIGNLILERFDIVIDFYSQKLYLKATKNYNKEFDFDKSGLTFFAFGPNLRQYFIKYVVENSPAYEADIRAGDVVLGIGNWSYKWYSLNKLNNIMCGKTGKKIKLKIKRDGNILYKEFLLRELF